VGSVFSPYYHWAFQKNKSADPENHCCINVALYGRGVRRWTMTERSRASMERSSTHFRVGPSQLQWKGDHLEIDLNEWSVPIPKRVFGTVRIFPERLFHFVTPLDSKALHHWGPIAPSARVEVQLQQPDLTWTGHAYLDSNEGAEPIIKSFTEWDWSRANLADGSVAVLYDIREKHRNEHVLALRFRPDRTVEHFEAPHRTALPKAFWRVGRSIRTDVGTPARVIKTLEDTPFYVRSVLESGLLGETVISMHETLNIPRLDSTPTRLMLPWKMPRLR
jgi:carotenoid 1,2-hydratase